MDFSKSQTATTEKNPRQNPVDVENIVLSFENIMLGEDEIFIRHELTTVEEGSSSLYTLEKYNHAIDDVKSKKMIKNQCPEIQETSGTTQLPSDRCYWGNPSFLHRGESSSSNVNTNRAESFLDFLGDNAESYAPESSNQQSGQNTSQAILNSMQRDLENGDFMLREDESSVRHESTPAKEEHSSSSSVYTLEKYQHAIDEIKSRKMIKNQCPAIQETSGTTQLLSDRCYGMWGNPSFWQRGESSSSNAHTNRAESVLDFFDDNAESYASGSSNQQSGLHSSYSNSSRSNLANQFISNDPLPNQFISNDPFLYNSGPGFSPMRNIIDTSHNGLYFGHEYYTDDASQAILNSMQKNLESGDYETIDRLLSNLQKYMISMMTDGKLHFVFQKFIDACEGQRLDSVIRDLSLCSESFIYAAFCRQGVHSIKKLIKKLKKTPHAFTLTTILSTRFLEMMTHFTARDVVLKCLSLFGTEPNMILYEKALKHLPELATHQVGCRSLNECIDMIPCQYRSNLLARIAYTSDFLSNDPFGNYVVQHVLGLRNEELTCIILQCLKGKFIDLATRKGGSHVVEKCMVSSKYGIVSVVQEILDCPKAAVQLAQHQFGNYVVQKALAKTKEQGFNGYHVSLVRTLEPHLAALSRTVGGKNVVTCLKRLM